jgi:hypothetical protein
MHPPLHANKSFKFKINEQDYFGSYLKMTESLTENQGVVRVEDDLDPSIVVISQLEIDQARHLGQLKTLF